MNTADLSSVSPAHAKPIFNAMHAYQECVEACAVLLRRRGITGLTPDDFATLGTGIEQVLAKTVQPHIDFFAPHGADIAISDKDKELWGAL